MTSFQFSEEATLYARDFEVVEEMRTRFRKNLGDFFDAVSGELRTRAWPGSLVSLRQGGSFYAYVSRRGEPSAELEPCMWCYWEVPETIRARRVLFSVARHTATVDEQQRVAALAEQAAVRPHVSGITRSKWSLFQVQLGWTEAASPVQELADRMEPILRALDAAR